MNNVGLIEARIFLPSISRLNPVGGQAVFVSSALHRLNFVLKVEESTWIVSVFAASCADLRRKMSDVDKRVEDIIRILSGEFPMPEWAGNTED